MKRIKRLLKAWPEPRPTGPAPFTLTGTKVLAGDFTFTPGDAAEVSWDFLDKESCADLWAPGTTSTLD